MNEQDKSLLEVRIHQIQHLEEIIYCYVDPSNVADEHLDTLARICSNFHR